MKPYWELELVLHSGSDACSKCGVLLPFYSAKLVKYKRNLGGRAVCESYCLKCGIGELVSSDNLLAAKRLANMGFDIPLVSSLIASVNERNGFAAMKVS